MTANLTLYRIFSGWLGRAVWPGVLLICFSLLGCASGPNANPRDPLEPFNRGVYQLNEKVDAAVLKPVATAYRDLAPVRVRQGIGNFFGNLEDVWSLVNNLLQLRGQAAIDSLKRIGVNTFIGWGGVFDVATEMDIEKHTRDFGHTLGYWGLAPGPYLVLPLLGPSTLRDAVALPVDWSGDVVSNIPHVPTRNTAKALRVVDTRSDLLKAGTMLEEAALDRYTFIRDAFLQRRRNVIYDGNPPEEDLTDTSNSQAGLKQLKSEVLIEAAVNMPTGTLDETLNTAGVEKAKHE
jgi:phospholipid-binding lipoprotein MlaA